MKISVIDNTKKFTSTGGSWCTDDNIIFLELQIIELDNCGVKHHLVDFLGVAMQGCDVQVVNRGLILERVVYVGISDLSHGSIDDLSSFPLGHQICLSRPKNLQEAVTIYGNHLKDAGTETLRIFVLFTKFV